MREKSFFLFFLLIFSAFFTSCIRNNARVDFEKSLAYFIGKPSSEVVRYFGRENLTYKNEVRVDGKQITYIVYYEDYDFSGEKYYCSVRFSMPQGKDMIEDWDYTGNGCF